jgi:AcrR family transcriptional regulator
MGKLAPMPKEVNTRRYDATRRRAAAAETRSAILSAARELFLSRGYTATTMTMIAQRSGVSSDTLYTVVGTKAVMFRELIETALSGRAEVIAGEDRDYVKQMQATPDIRQKLAMYAEAVAVIQQRLAPLFLVLREAASANPELAQLWREISERRARNMRLLTDDLASTGALRVDLSRDEIADIIWTMNSSEYFALLVLERGWTPARFTGWLRDSWQRLLLRE